MENASKALIIAGAILLAILLISLGILIFNQAQDTVNNNGMSDAEKTAVNNRFVKFEGKQNGTMVRGLVSEVLAYNAGKSDTKEKIAVTGTIVTVNPANNNSPDTSKIVTTNDYTVTLKYDTKTGLVTSINVSN